MANSGIILYESNLTDFTSQGFGVLSDAVRCEITEELNGQFELELEYPVKGIHYEDIAVRRIIVCRYGYSGSRQPFRIYKITEPISGKVTVYARHITYDLSGYLVNPFSASTLKEAIGQLKTASKKEHPFTISTDFNATADIEVTAPSSIRSIMGGDNGLTSIYGGEWIFDNFNCTLAEIRGESRNTVIRYGKNLKQLDREDDETDQYTAVIGYYTYSENDTDKVIQGNEISTGTFNYTKVLAVDCTSDLNSQHENTDGYVASVSDIDNYISSYILQNGIGKVRVSINLDFVQLEDVKEQIELGDDVHVYYSGKHYRARCNTVTWDALRDRYTSIDLGDVRESYGSLVTASTVRSSALAGMVGGVVNARVVKAEEGYFNYLEANYIKADEVEARVVRAETGIFDTLEAEYATIDTLEANYATIQELHSDYATITKLQSEYATINELHSNYIDTNTITAQFASLDYVGANFITTDQLDASNARIVSLESTYANVSGELTAAKASIDTLEANNAVVNGKLEAAEATIQTINANYVSTAELEANYATIDSLFTKDITTGGLTAKWATVENFAAAYGRIDDLESDHVTTAQLNAANAEITNLKAADATITGNLTAATGRIANIESDYITSINIDTAVATAGYLKTANLDAEAANVGYIKSATVEANYAKINLENVKNSWIENGTIKTAAISDAQISGVSANKITAGTIDASKITVTNLNADNITVGTINGARIGTGSIDLEKLSEEVPTKEYLDNLASDLQTQIDGAIQTFTTSTIPTLSNYPAEDWAATDLASHVGDICYVVNNDSQADGYCYRFAYDNATSTYGWVLIKDSDVTKALQDLLDAQGDISNLQSFQSTTSSWMTNTDNELSSVKNRTTSLETDLGNKVDTTTFNTLKQTVDENSSSITSLSTTVNSKADGSIVTELGNTVNTVKQTADTNSSTISSLTTLLGTNADGTTAENDIVHKQSALEQNLNGFKSTVSETYQTKNDMANYSTTAQMESAITQSKNAIELSVAESYATKEQIPSLNVLPTVYYDETIHGKTWDDEDHGITWTVNSDGSVTAKGTANGITRFLFTHCELERPVPTVTLDPDKTYMLHGCPEDGAVDSTYWIGYRLYKETDDPDGTYGDVGYDDGSGSKIQNGYKYICVYAQIKSGFTCPDEGITFYPMLESGEVIHNYVSTHEGTGALIERIGAAEATIKVNANNIELKVSDSDITGNYIVSRINLDSTSAAIDAERIDLNGKVTISNLTNDARQALLSSTSRCYYRSNTSTTPTISSSTSVGTSTNTDNVWSYAMPEPSHGKYYFVCSRYEHVDGSVTYSDVRPMSDANYTAMWCSSNDATKIDGDNIYSGTITAGKLAVNSVTAEKISVTDLSTIGATIGGFQIDSDSIHTKNVAVTNNGTNSVALSTSTFTRTVAGASRSGLKFAIGSNFGVDNTGKLYASAGLIGGWTIDAAKLTSGTLGANNGFHMGTANLPSAKIANNTRSDWRLGIGSNFGVTNTGVLYAADAKITGEVIATSGYIGNSANGWAIGSTYFQNGKKSINNVDNKTGIYIGTDGISFGSLRQVYYTDSFIPNVPATKILNDGRFFAFEGTFYKSLRISFGDAVNGEWIDDSFSINQDDISFGGLTYKFNDIHEIYINREVATRGFNWIRDDTYCGSHSAVSATNVSNVSVTVNRWGNVVWVEFVFTASARIGTNVTIRKGLPKPVAVARNAIHASSTNSSTGEFITGRAYVNTDGTLHVQAAAAATFYGQVIYMTYD